MIRPIIIALLAGLGAKAQVDGNGCLRLLGSVACPGFQYAYLSPGNLSNAFPFFSTVSSVATFDVAALDYFSNPAEFETTKFTDQLGCSNASNAVIRYERTVLCSMWVNERWSEQCLALYNGTTAATSQKMVCQDTCLLYSASENAIVNSTTYCPGPDLTNGNRSYQLNKDFVDCTDWTTLATNSSGSCVAGDDNEPNCGYGSSISQLCGHCAGDQPDDCCYSSTAGMSTCGFTLPVRTNTTSTTSSTSSSPSSTSSTGLEGANSGSSRSLSKGALAGIIIGSVLGGLLLLLALILLALFCIRRRKRNNRNSTHSYPAGSMAQNSTSTHNHGVFGTLFSTSPSSGALAHNSSEKGLLGNQSAAAKSSPTMGGDTLYSGKNGAAGVGAGMLGAGVGAGGMPGERTSGVVLPRVRDENQSGDRWIETGAEVTVLWPYQASLPDELDLRPGMKLKVLRLYDDAWGTAQVVSGGEPSEIGKSGAFPIVCVSEGSSLGSSAGSSAGSH